MSQINFHPAPGLGDLSPGWFVVPQNPLRGDSTVLVPSVQASAGGRVVRKPHIGEFVAASFVVPQNPVARNLMTGMNGLGCGCSTPACGDFRYQGGLQGFDVASVETWAGQPSGLSVGSMALPNWLVYGGAAAAAFFLLMPGGSEYRGKRKALRAEYAGYRRVAQRYAA